MSSKDFVGRLKLSLDNRQNFCWAFVNNEEHTQMIQWSFLKAELLCNRMRLRNSRIRLKIIHLHECRYLWDRSLFFFLLYCIVFDVLCLCWPNNVSMSGLTVTCLSFWVDGTSSRYFFRLNRSIKEICLSFWKSSLKQLLLCGDRTDTDYRTEASKRVPNWNSQELKYDHFYYVLKTFTFAQKALFCGLKYS